ncbi:hypothetical protein D3C85_741970 [compost metagenome]
MVKVGVLVLIGPDKSSAQRGVIVQGTRDVAFGAVVVPGTRAAGDRRLEIAGRFLAHQVDRGRRIARACHQPGSALDDFDPVVGGHVHQRGAFVIDTAIHRIDAIELVVGDDAAAAGIFGAFAVVGLRRDTRRIAQYIANVLVATVVHQLARHHGHRLRRFAKRQRQLGGRAGDAGRVGVGVFRGRAQPLAIDAGEPQFHCRAVGNADQHITAVGLPLGLQACTCKQSGQPLFHRVVAAKPGRALALGLLGVERQGDVRRGGEQAQHSTQWPRRNLVGDVCALRHGLVWHHGKHWQGRQGQAEQRQVDSANERPRRARGQSGHAFFLRMAGKNGGCIRRYRCLAG